MKQIKSVSQRFYEKVEIIPFHSCWEWTGYRQRKGYGQFSSKSDDHKSQLAHRVSYELHVGKIPDGLQIDHLCKNRGCVNPRHLEAVTGRENNRRSSSPTSIHGRKTHCPSGHEYSVENTYPNLRGRYCVTCSRARSRAKTRNKAGNAVGNFPLQNA